MYDKSKRINRVKDALRDAQWYLSRLNIINHSESMSESLREQKERYERYTRNAINSTILYLNDIL